MKPNRSAPRPPSEERGSDALSLRHLRFGWWSLLVFVVLGIVLEALHGLKVAWYLEIAHQPRRFTWTLAHAHGTLLAVVNVLLGLMLRRLPAWSGRSRTIASLSLLGATILLPAGFFVGGLFPYEGDPGFGIFLVPVGGFLLAVSVLLVAVHCRDASKG